jgi:hypothetical protein
MANLNPVSFLLNQDGTEDQVVDAPAFSLTKVLASLAVIVTPIATLLVDKIGSIDLHARNYVVLAVAVLAFLAIASAADVLARAIATAAATKRQLDVQNAGQLLRFTPPMQGSLMSQTGWDISVSVLALANVGEPVYLIQQPADGSLVWLSRDQVRLLPGTVG